MEEGFTLLVISSEHDFESEPELVTELFSSGLQIFHLRKPRWTAVDTQNFIQKIPIEFHSRIVTHSHFEISEEFNLKGIHLNEENRKSNRQFGNYEIVSTSFHSLEDLAGNKIPYQYVFLSPVFNSLSKTSYNAAFDLKELKNPLGLSQQNIIALGGVQASNIQPVKDAGFYGAAVLGAVWQNEDPVSAFLEIQERAV